MRKLIIGIASAAMLILAIPSAGASSLNIGGGNSEYGVSSGEFYPNFWSHSLKANNWYISPNNRQDILAQNTINGYQLLKDMRNGECLAMDWQNDGVIANEVIDETCNAANPAQQWQEFASGNINGLGSLAVANKYMNENHPQNCRGGWASDLRAQTSLASLNMACPMGNGDYWDSMKFVFQ